MQTSKFALCLFVFRIFHNAKYIFWICCLIIESPFILSCFLYLYVVHYLHILKHTRVDCVLHLLSLFATLKTRHRDL